MNADNHPQPYCQLHTVPKMSGGLVDLGPMPLRKRIKFWLKRGLNAKTKRKLKKLSGNFLDQFLSRRVSRTLAEAPNDQTADVDRTENDPAAEARKPESGLKAGDWIRVRSRAEIEATLDRWNEMKGCAVMPAMWQYCGTTQRVFKVVERFVDERDYRLKKGTGIILLEGLICLGTVDYGRCDRSCFYFWRMEWLEKIEE